MAIEGAEIGIYSVRDAKAEEYMPTITATKDALAVRMFQAAINDPEHMFHKHSADFTLWKIGRFNIETGALVEDMKILAHGPELKEQN